MTEKQSTHNFIIESVINSHSQQSLLQIVLLENFVQIFFKNLITVLTTDDLEDYCYLLKLSIIIHKVYNHIQE